MSEGVQQASRRPSEPLDPPQAGGKTGLNHRSRRGTEAWRGDRRELGPHSGPTVRVVGTFSFKPRQDSHAVKLTLSKRTVQWFGYIHKGV